MTERKRAVAASGPAPGAAERFLTIAEVSEILRLHPRTVREFIRRGELVGRLIGGRCPACQRPRQYLYPWARLGSAVVDYLGLRCQACAGLRLASQGRYRGAFARAMHAAVYGDRPVRDPLPRSPWDPRAVSDPRMVAREFPDLLL